ncbi:hypothetical protein NRO40_05545 [Streptomyces changanensis]|nr:hypothetical protein [Streptomyces changanensis]UUS34711.1 hypothetical protein NRO40_05545 [Streptomyces changanensis]
MVHATPGGLRARSTALAAAAVLTLVPLATACGGSEDASDAAQSPAIQTTAPDPTGSPTGATDAPADEAAARKEVEKNWTAFFDPETPTDEKVRLLENGEQMRPVLSAFGKDANAAKAAAKVKEVDFASATQANVTYDLVVGTSPALTDSKGTAVYQDGIWKVSRSTLCALVKISGNAAVPGC